MKRSLTILLVCFIAVFGLSYSLTCYECNYMIDPDPNCDTLNSSSAVLLQECDDDTRCLKLTIYQTNGINITMRQCANMPTATWCERLNNTMAVCELCDTDGCNDSPIELRP